jgi:putative FmdB family regulatory protein
VPIYEFRCGNCGRLFDRLVALDASEPSCPECGGVDVKRLVSVIAGLGASSEAAPASSGCGCGGACACTN